MFITFEGIDGSGKSTQIRLLKNKLESDGFKVQVFREPGGTKLSEKVRDLLLNTDVDINPVAELLLFSSARAQLIAEKVEPLLNRHNIVILDRYYHSTIAYQGYGRSSLPLADIHTINKIASHHLAPDITFYLRVSLEEARKRNAKNHKDRMERSGRSFYQKVIEGFNALAEQEEQFIAIAAEGSPDQTHHHIVTEMKPFLSHLS